jgi:molybdopterin molybdotransferase
MGKELFRVLSPQQALELMLERSAVLEGSEPVPLDLAAGRVLGEDIIAPDDFPPFDRSAVDGYAVRAVDTAGASEGVPAELRIVGEVPMGQASGLELGRGRAALVHTGGALPAGADAVVMLENAEMLDAETVAIFKAAAPGQNVIRRGEDYARGEVLLPAGMILREPELGLLAAGGILQVPVRPRPRVAVLAQGDEIVARDKLPGPGQVRDVHLTTLSTFCQRCGAEPVCSWSILPDRREAILQAAREAFSTCDLLILTAGSSVSARDVTSEVIQELGAPGLLFHGLAMRPGKPTVGAICAGKTVFGLPGHPVSALVVFRRLVAPVIEKMAGRPAAPDFRLPARLARAVPSEAGREDWVAIRLEKQESGWLAWPVFGKSNSLGVLARSHGLVMIPLEKTGLHEGEEVLVHPW